METKIIELESTRIALGIIDNECESHRENERYATKKLAELLIGHNMTKICHNADGSPYIEGHELKVSVSHSRNIAAVAIDHRHDIGIDIEQSRPVQLQRVATRVLSENELGFYGKSSESLLQAWTLKEALCKASNRLDADFRRDIILPTAPNEEKASVAMHNGSARGFNIIFSQAIEIGNFTAWLSIVRHS